MDPSLMIHTSSEKSYPTYHQHHNGRPNGVPHNQFGQQPLHPGFVLPPKYMSREEYCSVKSIDDSRASVYFTPLTNGGGAAGQRGGGTEDENMSQKSIQGTPIHINYIPEDIPEDIQMMYHELKPLGRSSDLHLRQSKRESGPKKNKNPCDSESGNGLWSANPERLCGGGSGVDTATEEEMMLMRMNFGRLGNLDEDTSEILMHELIQKKLKRDRRNRMRFYDERRRQQRLKEVGGNVVAEQGMIEGNSSGHAGGLGFGRLGGKSSSRRPVLASAMDPEFLRLINGGGEGLPIDDDHNHRRTMRYDYQRPFPPHAPARMLSVEEGPVAGTSQQHTQQQLRAQRGVEKADILYHSLAVPQASCSSTSTATSTSAATTGGRLEVDLETSAVNRKEAQVVENKIAAMNNWPHVRRNVQEADSGEEDDEDDLDGDRFSQRQMFTSKSLPEISRKRGKRRNKNDRVAVSGENDEGESGALLGAAAKSSIQMATIEVRREESKEPQTVSKQNHSRLFNCKNNNKQEERHDEIETDHVGMMLEQNGAIANGE